MRRKTKEERQGEGNVRIKARRGRRWMKKQDKKGRRRKGMNKNKRRKKKEREINKNRDKGKRSGKHDENKEEGVGGGRGRGSKTRGRERWSVASVADPVRNVSWILFQEGRSSELRLRQGVEQVAHTHTQ